MAGTKMWSLSNTRINTQDKKIDFVRQIVAVKPFLQLAGDLLCKMSTKRPMCETLKLGLVTFKNYVENKR